MFYKKELLEMPFAEPVIKKKGGHYFHFQVVNYRKDKLLVFTVYEKEKPFVRCFLKNDEWINYFPQRGQWNNWKSSDGIGMYRDCSFRNWDDLNFTDGVSLGVLDEFFKSKKTLNGYLKKIDEIQWEIVRNKNNAAYEKAKAKSDSVKEKISKLKFPHFLDDGKIKNEYFKDGFFHWDTEGGGEIYCTSCKRTFGGFKSNDVNVCPCCKNKAWSKPVKNTRVVTTDSNITEFFKSKGVVFAVVYRLERYYEFVKSGKFLKEGFKVLESTRSFPREIYIFEKGKTTVACSWYSHGMMYGNKYWCEGTKWEVKPGFREYAYPNYILPPARKMLKDTILEHSHIETVKKIANISILKYFHILNRHPNLENLVTNDFDEIVRDVIDNKIPAGSLNLKKAKLNEMLGINRDEQKRARAEGWTTDQLLVYKEYKNQGKVLDIELLKSICYIYSVSKNKLDVLKNYKLGFYLHKQREKAEQNINVVEHYCDYISMAKEIGYDFADEKVVFPPYLASAHDSLVRKLKYKPDSKRNKKYTEIKKALQEFEVSYNGLCLRIPNDDYDLFLEGKILDHCVGGEGFMNGHTVGNCIFFIRVAENDSVPLYTLNWNIKTGEQLQLHGYNNDVKKPIPPEIFEFISWWKDNVFRKFDVGKMEFLEKPKKDKKGKRTEKKAA